ncbi:hypothetical protein V1517DRAFT_190036 [Lipomyces orientalis]|uniref:Uncharacterized protein n=1 Tax=Lipomyces orientalis TaxID=1233043 RepID=A0ACC3TWA7_9ASCO
MTLTYYCLPWISAVLYCTCLTETAGSTQQNSAGELRRIETDCVLGLQCTWSSHAIFRFHLASFRGAETLLGKGKVNVRVAFPPYLWILGKIAYGQKKVTFPGCMSFQRGVLI